MLIGLSVILISCIHAGNVRRKHVRTLRMDTVISMAESIVDANTWERAIKKNDASLEAPSDNLLASMIKKNHRLSAAQMIPRKQALSTTPSYHTQNHTHFYVIQ